MTFDIIRRVLSDYFGYQVQYVMNITDIDDKIIKTARCDYLYSQYKTQILDGLAGNSFDQTKFTNDLDGALSAYRQKSEKENDVNKKKMYDENIENFLIEVRQFHGNSLDEIKEGLSNRLNKRHLKDIISDHLDSQYGETVTDHAIFKKLTLEYEQKFHEDMRRLNILEPSTLTRVSAHIENIDKYIQQIEANGFAYRSNGSVYFDTNKFAKDPRHTYAKLSNRNIETASSRRQDLDEADGELSNLSDKRCPEDFALWKKSKPGEPSWKSTTYEDGRPGWHIECSVMASHILGNQFDLHSGGCDLKFPHHDNEIAQAEAKINTGHNWVNYFIHSGHLHIAGCKMSKSLKNFVTIAEALEKYSALQLRLLFLSHNWTETLDYSTDTMKRALSIEKRLNDFFLIVKDRLRNPHAGGDSAKPSIETIFVEWTQNDIKLNQEFLNTAQLIDESLRDNLNTKRVVDLVMELIARVYKKEFCNLILIRDIAVFIHKIFKIFGANFNSFQPSTHIVEIPDQVSQENSNNGQSTEVLYGYMDTLASFRSKVRELAKKGETSSGFVDILKLCDELRDTTLPELGVRLQDKEEVGGKPYVLELVDKETLMKEKAMAEKMRCEKMNEKMKQLELQKQKDDQKKIPPSEMFKDQKDRFSQFDAEGIPTHDAEGQVLPKSQVSKLKRLHAEQKKKYNKYLESVKQ